eukprot:GEMP01084641.1.p1 GENE.GEMP01084641.1~~GEMP01084641.1.p1  ORF type:complete len:196 (+),score=27.72 GEMP01084641.1:100-687(+)
MLKPPAAPCGLGRQPSHAELLSISDRKRLDAWMATSAQDGQDESLEADDLEKYSREYREEFVHRNLQCQLFRNDYLAWCGMVVCTEPPLNAVVGSRLRGFVEVHGGLSFPCVESSSPGHFAFDCCHSQIDSVPYIDFLREQEKRVGAPITAEVLIPPTKTGTYKDYAYAMNELVRLADQLADEQEKRRSTGSTSG